MWTFICWSVLDLHILNDYLLMCSMNFSVWSIQLCISCANLNWSKMIYVFLIPFIKMFGQRVYTNHLSYLSMSVSQSKSSKSSSSPGHDGVCKFIIASGGKLSISCLPLPPHPSFLLVMRELLTDSIVRIHVLPLIRSLITEIMASKINSVSTIPLHLWYPDGLDWFPLVD